MARPSGRQFGDGDDLAVDKTVLLTLDRRRHDLDEVAHINLLAFSGRHEHDALIRAVEVRAGNRLLRRREQDDGRTLAYVLVGGRENLGDRSLRVADDPRRAIELVAIELELRHELADFELPLKSGALPHVFRGQLREIQLRQP